MARYRVSAGKEFDLEAVDLDDTEIIIHAADAVERLSATKVRRILALSITCAIAVALGLAAILGFLDGSYNEIEAVWSASALPLGYILATYFTNGS